MLIEEIKRRPGPVVREARLGMKFPERRRQGAAWPDALPTREAGQEVSDFIDSK